METIVIGKREYKIMFPDLLPPLTEDQIGWLRKSIRECGIIYPIVIDEEENVIDGMHRLRIAEEIGLAAVPFLVLKNLSEEGKRHKALTLNIERRQMTISQSRELRQQRRQRVLKARKEGMSIRMIAEKEGISLPQVKKDIERATAETAAAETSGVNQLTPDANSHPAKEEDLPTHTTGRDGKQYLANRKPKTTSSEPPESERGDEELCRAWAHVSEKARSELRLAWACASEKARSQFLEKCNRKKE